MNQFSIDSSFTERGIGLARTAKTYNQEGSSLEALFATFATSKILL